MGVADICTLAKALYICGLITIVLSRWFWFTCNGSWQWSLTILLLSDVRKKDKLMNKRMIRRLQCYLNYSRFYKHIYLIISISLLHIFLKIIKPIFHKNANPLTSGHFALILESLVYPKRTPKLALLRCVWHNTGTLAALCPMRAQMQGEKNEIPSLIIYFLRHFILVMYYREGCLRFLILVLDFMSCDVERSVQSLHVFKKYYLDR